MSHVRLVVLNIGALTTIAAAQGIDSGSELARRWGVSQAYASQVLRGKRQVSPSHVLTLAEALGVKPSELLDASESELAEAMDARVSEAIS